MRGFCWSQRLQSLVTCTVQLSSSALAKVKTCRINSRPFSLFLYLNLSCCLLNLFYYFYYTFHSSNPPRLQPIRNHNHFSLTTPDVWLLACEDGYAGKVDKHNFFSFFLFFCLLDILVKNQLEPLLPHSTELYLSTRWFCWTSMIQWCDIRWSAGLISSHMLMQIKPGLRLDLKNSRISKRTLKSQLLRHTPQVKCTDKSLQIYESGWANACSW